MFTVEARMILRPVSVDPVKAIRSTSGCAAAPPLPSIEAGHDVQHPRRDLSSCSSSTIRRTLSEASSEA